MSRRLAVLSLLAALAVFAVFSPLLRAPFLFDDHTVVEHDRAIVEASMHGDGRGVDLWRDLWRQPRPLRQLTHRCEWRIVGASPALPHAINILLHLAVGGVGFLLLRRRCGSSLAMAGLAMMLFLVNPVVVESLGIVSHRKEMLGALFLLLYLFMALRAPWRLSWVAAVFLLLAAAGKETALIAPVLFALMAFRAPQSGTAGGEGGGWGALRAANRAWFRPFAFYCAVSALGAAFFWWQIHESMDFTGINPGEAGARAGHFTPGVAWSEAVSASVRAFPRNLLLLVFPFGHSPDPPISLHLPFFSIETLSAAFSVAIVVAVVIVLARRRSPSLRPVLWIVFALGPYLFPVLLRIGATAVLADRYLYLPSLGLAWLLASLILRLPRRVAAVATILLPAIFAISSFRLCRIYCSETEYWGFASRNNPDSIFAAHNHAWGLWKEHGDFDGARKEFLRMLQLSPDSDAGVCSLAQLYAEANDPEASLNLLDTALQKRPESMLLHRQRALFGLLFDTDPKRSLPHFQEAERLGARDAAFHRSYADLLQYVLAWPEAVRHFELAGEDPVFAEDAKGARLLLHDPPLLAGGGFLVLGDSVPHGTGTDSDGGSSLSLAAALDGIARGSWLPPTMDASMPGSGVVDLSRQYDQAMEGAFASNAASPAFCVIMTGLNDAFVGASSFEILGSLAEAALACRRAGVVPILVGPIAVRDDSRRSRRRQEEILAALDRKLASFCASAGITFVSARHTLGPNAPGTPSGAYYDSASGNHLSRLGVERIARAVFQAAFSP